MNTKTRSLRLRPLNGTEIARLIGHFFAFVWPITFLIVTPAAFSIVSDTIIHIWMPMAALGAIGAIIGVLTRIDLKLELPSLYLLLVGPIIYWVAQVGIMLTGVDNAFQNRFALSFFVLWHISLLLPRLIELERTRRRERLKSKSRMI